VSSRAQSGRRDSHASHPHWKGRNRGQDFAVHQVDLRKRSYHHAFWGGPTARFGNSLRVRMTSCDRNAHCGSASERETVYYSARHMSCLTAEPCYAPDPLGSDSWPAGGESRAVTIANRPGWVCALRPRGVAAPGRRRIAHPLYQVSLITKTLVTGIGTLAAPSKTARSSVSWSTRRIAARRGACSESVTVLPKQPFGYRLTRCREAAGHWKQSSLLNP
jgi:hypothetical protein